MNSELRENEQRVLLCLKQLGGSGKVEQISETEKLAHAAVMRAALTLSEKGLIKIRESRFSVIELTDEGRVYVEEGLPERRLLAVMMKTGGEVTVDELAEKACLDSRLFPIALGWLIRKGWVKLDGRKLRLMVSGEPEEGRDERLLRLLYRESLVYEELSNDLKATVNELKRRKLVRVSEERVRRLELTDEGRRLLEKGLKVSRELTRLKPELIVTGRWRDYRFVKYNVKASVPAIWGGKKHPYLRFLDEVRRKLVAMGFKEMKGPTVESNFFNFDALFTPQDHPAREIFDIYMIKEPKYGDLSNYKSILERVKETHENGWVTGSRGWRYRFSIEDSSRLILRGHGTALSVRMLISDELEIPGKYFSIVRCYRPELVDRTHLSEFNQVEGIVVDEKLNLQDLLGVLSRFAIEIAGADDVRFRPDYFPFTEPSVELSAYKKGYGWMEFGGSGIFRPEVTKPLGIDVPVIAWGLGVDRLFMMKAGIDDIRYLFTNDLNWIRKQRLM
ncbi:phenylalanine--tRNA ligase subunit alpha [Candidatus Bathyarchaeota archaeon]|nr:phenylalanine--tRNA ligase subunit alpha [Candidatus Bathyarchaeota archaeon]